MSEQTPETPAAPAPEARSSPPSRTSTRSPTGRVRRSRKANTEAAGYRTKVRELEPSPRRRRSSRRRSRPSRTHRRTSDRRRAGARRGQGRGLRYKAAATHGIGEDYFDLLGSGDEETINARAERIGALVKTASEIEQLRAEVEALRAGKPAPITGTTRRGTQARRDPDNAQTEDDVLYNSQPSEGRAMADYVPLYLPGEPSTAPLRPPSLVARRCT
jgi:hypothetical protein